MQVDFFDNLRNRVVVEHHNLIQQLEYQYQHHILNLLQRKAAIHTQLQNDFYQKLVEIDHLIINTANNMASTVEQPTDPQTTHNEAAQSTNNNTDNPPSSLPPTSSTKPTVINIESSPNVPQTKKQSSSSNVPCNETSNSNSKPSKTASFSVTLPIWRCNTCNKQCKTKENYAKHIKSHSLQELRLFIDKHRDIYDDIELTASTSSDDPHDASTQNMTPSPSPPDILMDNDTNTADNITDASPFLQSVDRLPSIDSTFHMVNNDNNQMAELVKEEGNKLLKAQKYREAIEKYSKAIDIDGNNAIYFSNRALANIKLRDYAQAISDSHKALEIDRHFIKAYFREGQAYFEMKQYQKACDVYSKGLRCIKTDSKCSNKFRSEMENKLALCHRKLNDVKRYEPQCRFCEFSASTKDIVQRHELMHYPKPFQCNICEERFVQKQHLKKHMSIHSTSAHLYQCKQCRKPFKTNMGLAKHVQNAHVSSKCIRGSVVDDAQKYAQLKHRPSKIKNRGSVLDDGKKYAQLTNRLSLRYRNNNYNMAQHAQKETNGLMDNEEEDGSKGFECSYCESVFDTWNNLKMHIVKCQVEHNEVKEGNKHNTNTKVNKRIYECSVCHKAFKKQRYLTVHFRIHSGEKPYECHQCGEKFRSWKQRHSHLKKHFDGFPYQCDECKMKFERKNELNEHHTFCVPNS